MKLTPQQQEQIIRVIENGDSMIIIVGRNGEVKDSRKQSIMIQGDGNILVRDVLGALGGNKLLDTIVRSAVALVKAYKFCVGQDEKNLLLVSEEAAAIIWSANVKYMLDKGIIKHNEIPDINEQVQKYGYVLSDTLVKNLIETNHLPSDFDWKKYQVTDGSPKPITDKVYHLMDGDKKIAITLEGAKIIYEAYTRQFGNSSQTMDRREERGGIAHLSEIEKWKEQKFLSKEFDWTIYKAYK